MLSPPTWGSYIWFGWVGLGLGIGLGFREQNWKHHPRMMTVARSAHGWTLSLSAPESKRNTEAVEQGDPFLSRLSRSLVLCESRVPFGKQPTSTCTVITWQGSRLVYSSNGCSPVFPQRRNIRQWCLMALPTEPNNLGCLFRIQAPEYLEILVKNL